MAVAPPCRGGATAMQERCHRHAGEIKFVLSLLQTPFTCTTHYTTEGRGLAARSSLDRRAPVCPLKNAILSSGLN